MCGCDRIRSTRLSESLTFVSGQVVVAMLLCIATSRTAAEEPAAVPVRVQKVIEDSVPAEKQFVGTVEPARHSIIGSGVAGHVEDVFVEEGDLVTLVGDGAGRLVRLRLTTAQIELSAAQAKLDIARHELAELIRGPRPEELRRLEADVKRTKALLEYASRRLERQQLLNDRNSAGQSDLDEAVSVKSAAEQAWIVATAQFEEARNGTREERLAQARARQARASEEVKRLQTRLDDHTIRTPFRGYVVVRHAEKGAWIPEGGPVAEVVEVDPVEVRLAVPEAFISRLRPGMKARVGVAAIREGSEHSGVFEGTIFRIIPSADARSRAFPVRIRIHNPDIGGLPLIKPGMMARTYLAVGPAERSLLVSRDSVVLDGRQTSVFVIEGSDHQRFVRRVNIRLGTTRDLMIEIRPEANSKLVAGMWVVTEGNERLTDGQSVTVLEALAETRAPISPQRTVQ